MKYKYIHTPSCPHCGSSCTGYFIYGIRENDRDWLTLKRLQRGEYVTTLSRQKQKDDYTFFCLDCGSEWCGQKQVNWLSKQEIEIEKEKRQITKGLEYELEHYKEAYVVKEHKLKNKLRKYMSFLIGI